ncbi:hypothetical protein [Tenacibaculum finnmarkense]|uniref:hypothetical protein n=1 Tax=Tenacibaculum finnmarkense TaxID=2781243 RepID=UPI001E5437EE|nr:hypothetical protein [Tenacibaculum finnmarkense]MCD8443304.1 hypothetical protein [Tenacibaculum finnmarkense genomovar ulcerans]
MKDMLEKEIKVLNVNYLIYFVTLLFLISCTTKKIFLIDKSEYKIEKFKNFNRKITIYAVDNYPPYDTIIGPLIVINNLYFGENNSFIPGSEKNNIEIDFIGKIPVQIKGLIVKENDSVVITAYLKDNNKPLH